MSQHSIGMDSIGRDQAPSDASVEPTTDAPALPVGLDGLDRRRLLQGVGALAVLGMVGGPGRALADDERTSAATEADHQSVKSESKSSKEKSPDPGSQDGDTFEDHPDNAPPDKVVLSFFYNGTDSNYDSDFERNGRFQHGELVSRLGYYAQVASMKGSGGNQTSNSTRRFDGVGYSKLYRPRLHKVFGMLLGKGMRKDVTEITNAVMGERARLFSRYHDEEKPTELRVSLLGWSRGGIGSIYAAHKIAKQWQKDEKKYKEWLNSSGSKSRYKVTLKLCVVAMDPVSGKGTNVKARDSAWGERKLFDLFRKRTRWWQLDSNITEFHGFYAHDERSIGFAATIPSMAAGKGEKPPDMEPGIHLYEVPGTHSTLVGNTYPNGGSAPFKEFERSVRDMALTKHDAFFRSTDGAPRLSTDDRLPLYRSECEGKRPSTSSMCQDNPNLVDPVGQFIYRQVVTKVLNILTDFGVEFPDTDPTVQQGPTSDIETFGSWLDRLEIKKTPCCTSPYEICGDQRVILHGPTLVPEPKAPYTPKTPLPKLNDDDMRRTVAEKLAAYKARCQKTYIKESLAPKTGDHGRGVYVGSNKRQRHWHPAKRLSDFIQTKNYLLWADKRDGGYARSLLVSNAAACTVDEKRKNSGSYEELNCESKLYERHRLKNAPYKIKNAVTIYNFDPYTMDWTMAEELKPSPSEEETNRPSEVDEGARDASNAVDE